MVISRILVNNHLSITNTLRSQPKHNFCQSCHVEPEAAKDAASRDDGVSPGDRFFPGLQHGTSFKPHPNLVWLKVEVKDRFSGFHRSPQRRNPWLPQAAH